MNVWYWWVKKEFSSLIATGAKPLEARLNVGEFARARVGDRVIWNVWCQTEIKAIRRYRSFDIMLAIEKPDGFYPGATQEAILEVLHRIYPRDTDRGVICFELEVIN